jgi:hypothetical protein
MQFKYILFSDLFDLINFFYRWAEVRLKGEISIIINIKPLFIAGGVYYQ